MLKNGLTVDELAWLERTQQIDRSTLPEKLRHNLPDWLANPLKAELGDEGFWALVDTFSGGAPLDLRVNEVKAKRDEVSAALAERVEALTGRSPGDPRDALALRLGLILARL